LPSSAKENIMSKQDKDLSDLAVGAHIAVERQARKPAEKKPLLGPRGRAITAACAAVAGIVATYFFAGPYVLGLSEREMRAGLVSEVNAARDDVEAARKAKGALPDTIDNMAIAMVVEYHRRDGGYRLVASDGYRQVEMDESGNVTESTLSR
jgi:hypothetical protein